MVEGGRGNKKMYAKLAASLVLAAYVVGFVVANAGETATVWLFPFVEPRQMPTLLVIVITAVLSTLGWWLGVQLWRTLRRRTGG